MLLGAQIRAGRSLVRLEQRALAEAAKVSVETIKRLEKMDGPLSANTLTIDAIQRALEAAGVEFIDGGVKLRG